MILTKGLHALYSATIDRSKFREIASRLVVFVLPLFFWGRAMWWGGTIFVFLGVAIRAWAAGHLYKDREMANGGPYVLVRHPLYLGSCLLALGLILTLHHWFVTFAIGGVTILTYIHTIKHEEQNLLKRFGESYVRYCNQAGPIWPTTMGIRLFFSQRKGRKKFSFKQYLHNREYECLLGVVVILVALYWGSPSLQLNSSDLLK